VSGIVDGAAHGAVGYMLDTDVCIEAIRSKSSTPVLREIRKRLGMLAISAITLAELEHGVANSSKVEQNEFALMRFLVPFEVLPFDDDAAFVYGRVKTELRKTGLGIGPLDTLIAAHAIASERVLVSNNVKEFERVSSLKLESWG
jgi:tRNA(fMet)-specific endonuclease VapC